MVAAIASELGENKSLAQAASEIRQIDALARAGQQHLADHLVDVGFVAGAARPAAKPNRCEMEMRNRAGSSCFSDR